MQRVRLGMKLMTRQKDRWKQEEKKRKDKTGEKSRTRGRERSVLAGAGWIKRECWLFHLRRY